MNDINNIVEVLLFATSEPLTQKRLNEVLESNNYSLDDLINELNKQYDLQNKGYRIKKISSGFQMLSLEKYHIYIDRLFNKTRKLKLSKQAIEALSIVAYRQPISKYKVESIRGVECGSVLNTLMERDLIEVKGRGKTSGRPLLFGTTKQFLVRFGLNNINDLPKIKEISEFIGNNADPILFE